MTCGSAHSSYTVLRRDVAGRPQLVGDEPVAELRVVAVDVNDGLGQVCVVQSRRLAGLARHL